jgi:hypothetical protein
VGFADCAAAGSAGAGAALALPPKILNMTVPHVGHLPLIALRPFFIVSSTPSIISFLALHLTQYPSGIEKFGAPALHAPWQLLRIPYGGGVPSVNCEKATAVSTDEKTPIQLRSVFANR